MDNCIFCKIANGEIPAATLYEDENFRVILDLGPASKGHALILPKFHAANIYELSDEMAAKVMVLAKKMASAMTEALKYRTGSIGKEKDYITREGIFRYMWMNTELTVEHKNFIYLIPRYKEDNVGITWKPGELTDKDKEEILSKVKAQLS